MSDLINLTTINTRLDITLRTDFITDKLGVEPAGKEKRSTLWTEDQFVEICEKLQEHTARVQAGNHEEPRNAPKRTPKDKPATTKPKGGAASKPAADPHGIDDDDDDIL